MLRHTADRSRRRTETGHPSTVNEQPALRVFEGEIGQFHQNGRLPESGLRGRLTASDGVVFTGGPEWIVGGKEVRHLLPACVIQEQSR